MDKVRIRALTQIGCTKKDAVAMLAAAHKAMAKQSLEPNEQNLLAAALRAA